MKLWVGLMLIAGCAAPLVDDPATPDYRADEAPRPNLWLLDGIRPATDTRVSGGAEPSILTDREGKYVWIGDTSGLSITTDNGTTWSAGARPFLLSADGWTLAQDDTGDLYFATTSIPYIDVVRSSDGGRTATWVSRFVDVAPVADRPWIAARGEGEVVLFFYDYGRTFSETCARTTDGGLTWLDRSVLYASPQGGNAAFDAAGRFLVSDDNGRVTRFAACLSVDTRYEMFPGGKGAQHMVQVAVDGTDVYAASPSPDNGAIILSGSHDLSGSPKQVTVSPPQLRSNTFATVSAHEGAVAVAWYGSETAGDPSAASFSGTFNVYLALVDDFWGEATVRHVRLTDEPNHVGDICMAGTGCGGNADRDLLDYFMIDHDKWGGVHVAYGHDGTGSNAEVRYAHVPPTVAAQAATAVAGIPDRPVARFALETDGLTVHGDAGKSSGEELTFGWSWGDGTTSTGATASHTYDAWGAYKVRLEVMDAAGQSASAERGVVVEEDAAPNEAPHVDFQGPAHARVGQRVTFVDRSTDDGSITAWSWDLGDGTTASTSRIDHVYTSPGPHTVKLTVTDDRGATGTASGTLVVQEDAPADATATPWPAALLLVALLVAVRRP